MSSETNDREAVSAFIPKNSLSPSSLATFWQGKQYFIEKYKFNISQPQTEAMAIGTVFDFYVKQAICASKGIVMKVESPQLQDGFWSPQNYSVDEALSFTLSDCQHNHIQRVHKLGAQVMKQYERSGLLEALIGQIARVDSDGFDALEFDIDALKAGDKHVHIKCFPDLGFTNNDGVPVVLDWKVNGGASEKPARAEAGYESGRILSAEGANWVDAPPYKPRKGWVHKLKWRDQLHTYGFGMRCAETVVHQCACARLRDDLVLASFYVHKEKFDVNYWNTVLAPAYRECWDFCLHGDGEGEGGCTVLDER